MQRLVRNLVCFFGSAIVCGSFVFLSASWGPSSKGYASGVAVRSIQVAKATHSKQFSGDFQP